MPGTKTVLLMMDDPVFAHQLRLALTREFWILKFQDIIKYKTHAFFVIGTDTPDWPQLIHRLIRAKEKVAVVFAKPNPAAEKVVLQSGGVVLQENDSADVIHNALLKVKFITE